MNYGTGDFAQILQAMEKAVETGTIADIVPEDLEVEAHNTLWNETDQGELTILKILPSVPATSIRHEYARITSFGPTRRSTGFFGEKSLPATQGFGSDRIINHIRMIGRVGPVFLLAALEKTVKALGTTGAEGINEVALRRTVLWLKAHNTYFSDTRTTKDGANSLRFKGLFQLIEEGTDGTTGTSPYGSHVIDMAGAPLTVEALREKNAEILTLFGRISCLMMDPLVRGDLETSMDPAQRLPMPIQARPYLVGQNVGGIQTQGGVTYFETDNILSPVYARPQYTEAATEMEDGFPVTVPTATATAQADNATTDTVTSKWDSSSAGEVFYVVSETVQEIEGLGVRVPASTSAYITVAAGQEVALSITPGNPSADSFKVYRGKEPDGGEKTDAWFIFEVSNTGGGGAVAAFDNNLYRPNTSWAFGLNIKSKSLHAMNAPGVLDSYASAVDNSSSFLRRNEMAGNTVAVAELGPSMGVLELAAILATTRRPLVYSACCPELRNPKQAVAFINVGRA